MRRFLLLTVLLGLLLSACGGGADILSTADGMETLGRYELYWFTEEPELGEIVPIFMNYDIGYPVGDYVFYFWLYDDGIQVTVLDITVDGVGITYTVPNGTEIVVLKAPDDVTFWYRVNPEHGTLPGDNALPVEGVDA